MGCMNSLKCTAVVYCLVVFRESQLFQCANWVDILEVGSFL